MPKKRTLKMIEKAIEKRRENLTRKELRIILEEVKANIEDHTVEKYKGLIRELTNVLKKENVETAISIINKIEELIEYEYYLGKKRNNGCYYIG